MKRWTVAAGVLFFLSVIGMDSDTWLPLIVCVGSAAALAWAAHKGGWFYDPERDDAE